MSKRREDKKGVKAEGSCKGYANTDKSVARRVDQADPYHAITIEHVQAFRERLMSGATIH